MYPINMTTPLHKHYRTITLNMLLPLRKHTRILFGLIMLGGPLIIFWHLWAASSFSLSVVNPNLNLNLNINNNERPNGGIQQFAILVPFIAKQTNKILFNWKKMWQQHPPCENSNLGLRAGFVATLVLYFDQSLDKSTSEYNGNLLRKTLLQAWQLPEMESIRGCFQGGLQFIDLDREPLNHFDGSCIMFYEVFKVLEERSFGHFLLMEPDVQPIQNFWLDRLTHELNFDHSCSQWWMKGSHPKCPSSVGRLKERRDFHINGKER
jgi:hypothetical protein